MLQLFVLGGDIELIAMTDYRECHVFNWTCMICFYMKISMFCNNLSEFVCVIRRASAQRRCEITSLEHCCVDFFWYCSFPGSPWAKQVLLNRRHDPLDPSILVFLLSPRFFRFLFCFLFDSIVIDFWTPRLIRYVDFYNRHSTFSCFEKVIISDDFWSPKRSPKPRFVMFFGLSLFDVFFVFVCVVL